MAPDPAVTDVPPHGQQECVYIQPKILAHHSCSPPYQLTRNILERGTPNQTMLKSDYLAILFTLILTAFIHVRIRRRPTLPFPPGPKKWPLLGNLFDLPTSYEWLTYAKLCKECSMYGGLALFNSC